MTAIRRFHYYDLCDFGRNVTYCHDMPDMPHKSATWAIQPNVEGNGITCVSYDTTVADLQYMPNGYARLMIYGWYISATTRKHIRWFLQYIGVDLPVNMIKGIDNNGKYYDLMPGEYIRH